MSEEVIKALMQLFAVVTYPGDSTNPRRAVVEAFLKKQLNNHRTSYFLGLFDLFYSQHQSKFAQKDRIPRRLSATSVKALKIASSVNDELTYYQKLIVIIQLVEFLNSAYGVLPVERDFIDNVAQILHIDNEDYQTIAALVLGDDATALVGEHFLMVSQRKNTGVSIKTWELPHFPADLVVANIKSANILLMKFLGDAEITINGQLAEPLKAHVLRPGATVRGNMGEPVYFSDLVMRFRQSEELPQLAFEVNDISYRFSKRKIGLFPMSFSAQSGNLVGIMGDSGAGKTTLVNLLCGIYRPSSGTVRLNGINIHDQSGQMEGLIGYVSQDDLLMEDLTVFQNLFYNAKLCFDNLTEDEIRTKVVKLLESMGLHDIRNMKVGSPLNKNISGGQRKRLNIALELIREPAVLFLDEPTSGLSSRDSENIVDLLKELSAKGKLVFVVIHQPSSDVFKMFNHLLVLDTGGYLIYNGDALGCIPYFKKCVNHANFEEGECPTCGNVNAEQVLGIVHAKIVDEYGSFTPFRKIEPSEWYEKYKDNFTSKAEGRLDGKPLPQLNFKIPNRLKQFLIYLQRDALSKFANKQYLTINGFETPILALVLALLLRYFNTDGAGERTYVFAQNPNLPVYMIISVIIAFFVGLTVSAEEIINDRKLLKRESFLNLSRLGYIFSKVALLGVLSAVQMALFVWIGNGIMGIREMYLEYWMVLFSTALFANLLGLIISDTLTKTVNIYIVIPFLIIPQLILSGVFVNYDRLNPNFSNPVGIPWYGEIIVSRWSFEAMAVNQYVNNRYQTPFFDDEMQKSQALYMKDYWVPAMQNYVAYCQSRPVDCGDAILLLKNELERPYRHLSSLPFGAVSKLKGEFVDRAILFELNEYLANVKNYYKKAYNVVDGKLDKAKRALTQNDSLRLDFLTLKNNYYNEDLERFLKGSDRLFANKLIEYNNRLEQKSDPVFKEPEGNVLIAHYFSPYKYLFGLKLPTLYANLLIIAVMNVLMFLVLYFRGLHVLSQWLGKGRSVLVKLLKLD